jgi:FMN phosphatase YigB (HAD superfamily)
LNTGRRFEAILFDLDNTLIHFDEHRFFERYMRTLAPRFADLWNFEDFQSRMLQSIQALLQNDGTRTNANRFLERFAEGSIASSQVLWDRFTAFYAAEFDGFRDMVEVQDHVASVLDELRKAGIRLVIASNPVWPMFVQEIRLGWAGLRNFPFDFITSIENMGFCKPNPDYYRQISERIGVPPGACLMAGNDPVNDLAAARIGMKTYLVNEVRSGGGILSLNRPLQGDGSARGFTPDFNGPLHRIPAAVMER